MERIAFGEAFAKLKKTEPVGDITVERVEVPEERPYDTMPGTGIAYGGLWFDGVPVVLSTKEEQERLLAAMMNGTGTQ